MYLHSDFTFDKIKTTLFHHEKKLLFTSFIAC